MPKWLKILIGLLAIVIVIIIAFLIYINTAFISKEEAKTNLAKHISVDEEDIYLDEFADEIDMWIIDALKNIGCYTAKNVLNMDRNEIIERADLEEQTVDEVLSILAAEFEEDE